MGHSLEGGEGVYHWYTVLLGTNSGTTDELLLYDYFQYLVPDIFP